MYSKRKRKSEDRQCARIEQPAKHHACRDAILEAKLLGA